MKLSEAILLGSTMKPQTRGAYKTSLGTCALGAAFDAIGRNTYLISGVTILRNIWPWTSTEAECPSCWLYGPAGSMIVHLNDHHRWTRERIAEWVATVEPKEEAHELDKGHCIATAGAEDQGRVGEIEAYQPEDDTGLPVSIFG